MAKLKPLASITTFRDMRAYVLSEAKDAASKCPAAYGEYNKAIQILDTYATFEGTVHELTYVETARLALLEARKTWYAVGCTDPNAASPEPARDVGPVIPDNSIVPAGMGSILLIGGALFAAMIVFGKKKPARKATKKRVTRRYRRR